MHIKVIDRSIDLIASFWNKTEDYPFLFFSAGNVLDFSRYHILMGEIETPNCVNPLDQLAWLDEEFRRTQRVQQDWSRYPPLPFYLGWFVYLSYEAFGLFEPTVPVFETDMPLLCVRRVRTAIIVDRQTQKTYLLAHNQRSLKTLINDVQTVTPIPEDAGESINATTCSDDLFVQNAQSVQRYLKQGDSFQVNLSRAWQATAPQNFLPIHLYRRLLKTNPAPLGGYFCLGEHRILSCSPERLFLVRDGKIVSKPIAGTMQASYSKQQAISWFKNNKKECAEHMMIVDLLRNDINKISQQSAFVDPLMAVESYPNLHHMVSSIHGELDKNWTPTQVLRALFPGGSITGCPKIETARIIHEIEKKSRGFYTGSVGYVCASGAMDFNILIRSLKWHHHQLTFSTGSGVVMRSDPYCEAVETNVKAQPILNALQNRPFIKH